MKENFWKKIITGLLLGLISAILVLFLSEIFAKHFFFRMESQTYDWRMRRAVQHPDNPIDEIVIIDIDERSIQKLGSYYHWPREYWQKLINFLKESNVSVIGLDIIFDPDPRHAEGDKKFQETISEAGMVYNAFYFSYSDPDNYRPAMANEPKNLDCQKFRHEVPDELFIRLISQDRMEPIYPGFLNAGLTAGFVSLYPDPDGVLRRIPVLQRFNENVYAAFSVQIAIKLLNITKIDYEENSSNLVLIDEDENKYHLPIDNHGQMLIHYIGGYKSFRYISFYDVLMGFMDPNFFADKKVLVGTSLPALYDLRSTPLQASFPGVEVNANVLYQIMHSKYIYQLSGFQRILLLLIFGLMGGMILIFLRPIGSILITSILIFLVILGSIMLMELFSFWVTIVPLLFTIILAFTSTYVFRYLFEERDKRRIRKIFSHYVSHSVVDDLLKNPEKVKLGGEKKFCTVMFSDIIGFTTISEKMEPGKLVNMLNDYLTSMTNIIINNKGMLDKYEGDAIMAVFGAPVELPNSAELACISALQMQKQLELLRSYWKKIDRPLIEARIGINSGDMVVGNMGSETRFDYTVVGDSVNLASRLEGANTLYNTKMIIGEQTHDLVHEKFYCRPLDLVRVKGKQKPVRIYELVGMKSEELDSKFKEMILEYKKGFKEYLLRNWMEGKIHFEKAIQLMENDGPSKLYMQRCEEFANNPPPDDWDGVYSIKTK